MQRRLVPAAAWVLATGAAVTLSWFGVHTVLSGTAYDLPRATPLSNVGAEPEDSATRQPESSSSPSKAPRNPRNPQGNPPMTPDADSAPPSPPQAGKVESFTADGGRVTLDLRRDWAALVSATPNSGWQMQVRKQQTWIRVTFAKGDRESSVFCTWHDSAPRVQRDEHQA